MKILTAIMLLIWCFLMTGLAHAAAPGRWYDYETLNDNAKNGIDFTWKRDCKRLDDKACLITWKWRNRYQRKVSSTYRITYTDAAGSHALQRDIVLPPGESQGDTLVGEGITLVQVGVERSDVRNAHVKPFADAEEERIADRKLERQQERDRELDVAAEEAARAQEYQLAQARRAQQIQERKQEERDEQARHDREVDRQDQEMIRQRDSNFQQQLAGIVANNAANMAAIGNRMAQVDREVNAELQRRKDEAEQQRREAERNRQQQAADLQRQQDANRRAEQQRVAQLDQQRRDDDLRRQQAEQQRQQAEQQRVAQQSAVQQSQQKTEACTEMTSSVSGKIWHPKGAGACDGQISATLTNNSNVTVSCKLQFEKNGSLTGLELRADIQPGATSNLGMYSCGHLDSDSYKYYCVADSDPLACKTRPVR
jgi:hypothetical protein